MYFLRIYFKGAQCRIKHSLKGKVIIVTGASSGIGRSAAIYFLNCGANVILAGQDKETMVSMCKEFGFKNATIMTFDLINDQGIFDFKTAIVETLNKIDILVTCHGILFDGDIEKYLKRPI